MIFICYSKCSTCQKAKTYLDNKGISYEQRDIKEKNPTYDELKLWSQRNGFPVKKFFNTSGLLYKELGLKNKLTTMSDDECFRLLATNGMLVKRPLLVSEDVVFVGFKPDEWKDIL